MNIPTTNRVIADWGERKLFGKTRNYGAIGYRSARSGESIDIEGEHRIIVELVLARYSNAYERAITNHVRDVLELRVERFEDLRRWPIDVPGSVWDHFLVDVYDAIKRAYAALGTFE